jgi:hypothetical protein
MHLQVGPGEISYLLAPISSHQYGAPLWTSQSHLISQPCLYKVVQPANTVDWWAHCLDESPWGRLIIIILLLYVQLSDIFIF